MTIDTYRIFISIISFDMLTGIADSRQACATGIFIAQISMTTKTKKPVPVNDHGFGIFRFRVILTWSMTILRFGATCPTTAMLENDPV